MGGMIAASTVLKPISDKPGSIEFLTLPATNVEKFLSRMTIVTLGFALSALVSLVAVGALYYLLAAIFGLDAYGSLTFYCLKVLFTPTQMLEGPAREAWSWQGTLASYGFLVCLQSMFMLGGSVWRRFPLVKTLGVVVALASSSLRFLCISAFTHKPVQSLSPYSPQFLPPPAAYCLRLP